MESSHLTAHFTNFYANGSNVDLGTRLFNNCQIVR
nr:MAG TPA: hypothetical protein [Caudoviricetes sp.]